MRCGGVNQTTSSETLQKADTVKGLGPIVRIVATRGVAEETHGIQENIARKEVVNIAMVKRDRRKNDNDFNPAESGEDYYGKTIERGNFSDATGVERKEKDNDSESRYREEGVGKLKEKVQDEITENGAYEEEVHDAESVETKREIESLKQDMVNDMEVMAKTKELNGQTGKEISCVCGRWLGVPPAGRAAPVAVRRANLRCRSPQDTASARTKSSQGTSESSSSCLAPHAGPGLSETCRHARVVETVPRGARSEATRHTAPHVGVPERTPRAASQPSGAPHGNTESACAPRVGP